MRVFLFLTVFLSALGLNAQCDIKSKVSANGSLFYYIEPVRFYWTEAKYLNGGVTTDKESYFIEMQPYPFPPKADGKKLKGNLEVLLSDGKTYTLEHYDTHYSDDDSVFTMLFLINKDQLEAFKTNEVEQVKLKMSETETRTYRFKLHKAAIKEQLACFLKEK